ncbi:TetR/AcrR family transcriptional regulator [Candidatus Aminicenantes bacterium AC-335-B20]|jgi:AcrR family transcriptional regulator|nr:TetR/AcrR family transcriptional regulator [SCandidatus Aminicenantes bacterium Aminicenantia_JdfR_composite]MCP2599183.1 TetR/AcrR family transcriptional regulator [Candidatus Aminicenantes bacterium AC-335-B20]
MKRSIFSLEEETRKKEIIDISLKIVDEYGVKGLTVARIAKEIGFAESALYRHFKSKKEIISLILDSIHLEAKKNFKEIVNNAKDVFEALSELLKNHLEFLEKYPGIFKVLYSDEIHIGDEFLLEKLNNVINTVISIIENAVNIGKRKKLIKENVNPALAAIHFLGIVQTAFSFWTIKNRKSSLIKIGDSLLNQFFEGIRA